MSTDTISTPQATTQPTLNNQRMAIGIVAVIGALAGFLPWFEAPIVGSVTGTALDWGWITAALFIVVGVVAYLGGTALLSNRARIAITVAAGSAVAVGVWNLVHVLQMKGDVSTDNPIGAAMAELIQPGIGLPVLILAGIGVLLAVWLPSRKAL